MKTILLFLAVSAISCKLFAQSPACSQIERIYSFKTNGINYEVVKQKLDWMNAAACAVSRGGKLAEINSKNENDSIFYYVKKAGILADSTQAPDGGNGSYLWLGANDIQTEGKWIWNGDNDSVSVQFWQGTKTGNAVNGLYNNWGDEPDNYQNKQHALGFAYSNWPRGSAGQWNDVNPSNLLYYIIEYPDTTNSVPEIKHSSLFVYPNPVNDVLTMKVTEDLLNSSYKVTDILGNVLLKGKLVAENSSLTIYELPNGIYFLSLEGKNKSIKIIKK